MDETMKNLTKAFMGESMARNRYAFYAKAARSEGFEQIAEIFLSTADNEREHASWFFKHLNLLIKATNEKLDEITVETSAPTVIGTTVENLKAAMAGEVHEYTKLYPEFAEVADREGHPEVAKRFREIAKAEEHHAERYKKLLNVVETGTVFKKDKEVWWVCRECGRTWFGKEPPKICPTCGHSGSFYQLLCEVY